MPLTVYIALSVHYLMASSQVEGRGDRWYHPPFTDAQTGWEAPLARARRP